MCIGKKGRQRVLSCPPAVVEQSIPTPFPPAASASSASIYPTSMHAMCFLLLLRRKASSFYWKPRSASWMHLYLAKSVTKTGEREIADKEGKHEEWKARDSSACEADTQPAAPYPHRHLKIVRHVTYVFSLVYKTSHLISCSKCFRERIEFIHVVHRVVRVQQTCMCFAAHHDA